MTQVECIELCAATAIDIRSGLILHVCVFGGPVAHVTFCGAMGRLHTEHLGANILQIRYSRNV